MKSFPSPRQETESPPLHGGDLEYASRVFGVPEQDWQDLSTGVSPWGYPLDAVPQQFWQRLPADSDPLISAAADYYGVAPSYVVPVPGSQYAIARLPQLLTYGRPSVVAVPATGYGEHARQWRRAGHGVLYYESLAHLRTRLRAKQVQHAVVINPNNPTAQWLAGDELRDLAQALPGYLVVDEAFADLNPRHSLTSLIPRRENLVILRSVGKFFGLAGIRLGFVLGAQAALIRAAIEPWAVSGPALWAGAQALRDSVWQAQQRLRILTLSARLQRCLQAVLPARVRVANAGLFITLSSAQERAGLLALYEHLARCGVFTRWGFEAGTHLPAWCRIGLPDDNGARLRKALGTFQWPDNIE